ncbi:MAG TPA: GNAT family protein [Candidatus Limnocylindrales bacterium]|nr:GNAT family protein [Candidatus Limnocylindrales bacterium]
MNAASPLYGGSLFSGPRVRLTAVRPEDVATVTRWYEDSDFTRQYDASASYPRSANRFQKILTEVNESDTAFMFAIRLHHTDDLIGVIDLDYVLWSSGVTWLAIGIGEAAYRGQGYGGEALELALRFAFHEINMHRVQLTVFSTNERAIRLYERLGFTREGVLREFLHRDGQRFDTYVYGLLAREWEARQAGGGEG